MFPDFTNTKPATPPVLRALSLSVCERRRELKHARHALHAERREQEALQTSVDEVDEALRRALEGLRDAVMSLGGMGAAQAIGLGGPIPRDPEALLRLAESAVAALRGPVPGPLRVSGRALDVSCTADRIDALAWRLRAEQEERAEQRRRLNQARRRVSGALERYEAELSSAVSVLVGLADFTPGGAAPAWPRL